MTLRAPAGRIGTLLLQDGTTTTIDAPGRVTVDAVNAPALMRIGFAHVRVNRSAQVGMTVAEREARRISAWPSAPAHAPNAQPAGIVSVAEREGLPLPDPSEQPRRALSVAERERQREAVDAR